ncbi:MAG TPA: hypothetical protein PKI37_02820 [Candidatus Cloacimonas sp.]|nr:hypothetical protein [Candidatus Cloacimonas sp.]
MPEIKEEKGKQAAVEGFANEHIVVGLLMKKFQNVSLVDLPLSPYDIIIVLPDDGKEKIIRAQVKTSSKQISFTGGSRGGVDREYKSSAKTYIQSSKTADVVIGVKALNNNTFDLYFVPTVLIEILDQKSISLKKIPFLKNNYDILEKCQDSDYVLEFVTEKGLLKNK